MSGEFWSALGAIATIAGAAFAYRQLRGQKAKLATEVFARGTIHDGVPIHGGPLLLVSVVNTGGAVIGIDRLEVHRYRTILDRLMARAAKVHRCEEPSIRGSNATDALPYGLKPGERWTGTPRAEATYSEFRRGDHWFAIYIAGQQRPLLRRIPKS
ncbi:hypothetical protein [Neorhizobium galegae]|uniref:hypothetical protein n=1 Tax=Neorhizobium galegae TaxID=399 RepID=UPI002106331B|nr:hypothetical protein [Neorhizobium galegae]MCQ1799454.1 hypothetical protein [Neorhizobium galegae]